MSMQILFQGSYPALLIFETLEYFAFEDLSNVPEKNFQKVQVCPPAHPTMP